MDKLAVNRLAAISMVITVVLIKFILVSIVTVINNEPLDAHPVKNVVFLMF